VITEWTETTEAGVTHPAGFRAAGARAGLKREGTDLALIVSDRPAAVAGVFTTNAVKASCVAWSAEVARGGSARAIVANSGNANCCNGPRGDADNRRMAELTAQHLNIAPEHVATASTGIIGHPLDLDRVEAGIAAAVQALDSGPDADLRAARAIMTTDLVEKQAAVTVRSSLWPSAVRIGGMCKGSGMIAPRMAGPHATMLCFLTTDARVPAPALQRTLEHAVRRTFNRITVDGDTSTNDMVLVLAGGQGEHVSATGGALDDFAEALERICLRLAREVARDGEGATKLAEVCVRGARSQEDAERIARTVAESPLVKTALYGCDPNWGRILMAVGRAGVPLDPARLDVLIGDTPVFIQGARAEFDTAAASAYLSRKEVRITVDLHSGDSAVSFWTCDYSYDYIRINAEYHT